MSAAFASFHIFKDHELLRRVRDVIDGHVGNASVADVDSKDIAADPLLSSIYAETLRRYIKVYSAYMSAHEDVLLGKWWLPKGKMCITNSGPSHSMSAYPIRASRRHLRRMCWKNVDLIAWQWIQLSGTTKAGCIQSNLSGLIDSSSIPQIRLVDPPGPSAGSPTRLRCMRTWGMELSLISPWMGVKDRGFHTEVIESLSISSISLQNIC